MAKGRKQTIEQVLPRAAVAEVLARLTAEAPQGRLVLGDEVVELAGDWDELKVSLKVLGDACLLKVRLKGAAPDRGAGQAPGDTTTRPSEGAVRYKDLKKRMKQTFKFIGTALAAGQVPDSGIVASFLADSRLMTTYPGKGDAFYPAYDAAVDRLEAAVGAGDPDAMRAAVSELARLKKECHSRYA